MNGLEYYITEKEVVNDTTNQDINTLLNNKHFFSDFIDEENIFCTLDYDNTISQEIDYNENYNVDKIRYIYNFYYSSKKKIKKSEMINNIILFENNPENSEIVYNRKRMWYYLNQLKNDSYFKKFIIFN